MGGTLIFNILSFYVDASNNPHHLCLVVYHLHGGNIPSVKKHGNCKSDVPFHPTWTSTKQRIKEECILKGPKGTIASVSGEVGGVIKASAPGLLPRNEKQVSNFKSALSCSSKLSWDATADNLFITMQQAYTEDPHQRFVRAVNAAPEPAVVIASNTQDDLVRFCTSS